jgi:rhamnosyl/mannosyltransferase
MRTLWNDPRMARAMGQRAEARYWQLFTSAQMAENYARLYEELVARKAEVRLTAAARLG